MSLWQTGTKGEQNHSSIDFKCQYKLEIYGNHFFLPINVPGLSTVSHPTEVMNTVYRWASWTLDLLYN